jgi:phosphoribosylanthranilate isomerase
MMQIKVCGIREKENMLAVAALQPDMMGFIFFPASPRYVLNRLQPEDLKLLPQYIRKVGVFVNETDAHMIAIAEKYHLQAVQLHGNETPELCTKMKLAGLFVIKAFGVNEAMKWDKLQDYKDSCDMFLFDTASSSHGGTGRLFDWSLLQAYTGTTPFLLSGGIGPEQLKAVLSFQHPAFSGIDVNSRFETAPGVKDVALLQQFIQQIRNPYGP